LGKARKKTAQQFEVLITGEFYGATDSWTEYLCLARNADGSITLSSRSREILAEAARYRERDLPATIRRKEVAGFDGDYVVGTRLRLQDGDAEITISPNQFDLAAGWLTRRKWHLQTQFGQAWIRIRSALYPPGFFTEETQRLLPNSGAEQSGENVRAASGRECDGQARSQSAGDRPREIIIRASGPTKPWITWVEIVFIEGSKNSFSVYARTAEAIGGGTAQSPGLGAPIQGRLNWRTVLKFVRSHGLADLSGVPLDEIVISGVQPWQRDVITAAMLRQLQYHSFPQQALRQGTALAI
jgi:hypothetical protein